VYGQAVRINARMDKSLPKSRGTIENTVYKDNAMQYGMVYIWNNYMSSLLQESSRRIGLDPPLAETSWFLQPIRLSSLPAFFHFVSLPGQVGIKGVLLQLFYDVLVLGLDGFLDGFAFITL
jgi:hypothetical protein